MGVHRTLACATPQVGHHNSYDIACACVPTPPFVPSVCSSALSRLGAIVKAQQDRADASVLSAANVSDSAAANAEMAKLLAAVQLQVGGAGPRRRQGLGGVGKYRRRQRGMCQWSMERSQVGRMTRSRPERRATQVTVHGRGWATPLSLPEATQAPASPRSPRSMSPAQAQALVFASHCASGANATACSAWAPLMDAALVLHNATKGASAVCRCPPSPSTLLACTCMHTCRICRTMRRTC